MHKCNKCGADQFVCSNCGLGPGCLTDESAEELDLEWPGVTQVLVNARELSKLHRQLGAHRKKVTEQAEMLFAVGASKTADTEIKRLRARWEQASKSAYQYALNCTRANDELRKVQKEVTRLEKELVSLKATLFDLQKGVGKGDTYNA